MKYFTIPVNVFISATSAGEAYQKLLDFMSKIDPQAEYENGYGGFESHEGGWFDPDGNEIEDAEVINNFWNPDPAE